MSTISQYSFQETDSAPQESGRTIVQDIGARFLPVVPPAEIEVI
jgi:hypothetical protein